MLQDTKSLYKYKYNLYSLAKKEKKKKIAQDTRTKCSMEKATDTFS